MGDPTMVDVSRTSEPIDAPSGTPDASLIMQVGMGFWPSKTLLSAVELGLFTMLGSGALTRTEIAERLGLRSRAVDDFLDGLLALRLVERDGQGERARYKNTADTAFFLDRSRPSYSAAFWRWPTTASTASGAG